MYKERGLRNPAYIFFSLMSAVIVAICVFLSASDLSAMSRCTSTAEATVLSSDIDREPVRHRSMISSVSGDTYYVSYKYFVDGVAYSFTEPSKIYVLPGDTFDIRYDPGDPSVRYNPDRLLTLAIMALMACSIGIMSLRAACGLRLVPVFAEA